MDLVEVGEEDEDPPEVVEFEEEDEDLELVVVEEEEDGFADEPESSLRAPQVSVALSSTSWAERDTEGLCDDSPGSSTAVSSKGLIRSSIKLLPNGLSSGPANRTGMAQRDAANVKVNKISCFMVNAPFEPVFCPDFVSNSRFIGYTINLNEGKIKSDWDFF